MSPRPASTASIAQTLGAEWPALLALAHGPPVDGAQRPPSPYWPLYAPIASGRADPAFVVAQLGQSLDGRIATATGQSRTINGAEGIAHLHRLRALVDAVVVGVGTVLADDPQMNVREAAGPSPARVVIDPNFRLPSTAQLLHSDGGPVWSVQGRAGERPAGARAVIVAPQADGRLDPCAIIAALAAQGFRRILIEGGARTVSDFLAAGAVNRLHVSVAPMLIGSGPVGVNLPPIDDLSDALRPAATVHRLGDDMLFDCAF